MSTGPDQSSPKEINSPEKVQQSPVVRDFNALFADIENFNSQFSMGSIMASLLISNVGSEDGGNESNLSSVDKDAQALTASGISLIHEGILSKVGLELEPVSGKNATLFSGTETAGEGEMRVNLKDNSKFLSFIRSISLKESKGPELRKNLGNLSDILARQIIDHYNLKEPSDEALKLLGGLGNIVNEYKRLEIDSVRKLETLLAHSRKGDLLEYLAVQQQGLLNEPGKNFGPADWQRDATPKYLKDHWSRALQVLELTRKNANAQDLYQTLFPHLDNCLGIAIQNLDTLEYLSEEQKKNLRDVLLGVKESFG